MRAFLIYSSVVCCLLSFNAAYAQFDECFSGTYVGTLTVNEPGMAPVVHEDAIANINYVRSLNQPEFNRNDFSFTYAGLIYVASHFEGDPSGFMATAGPIHDEITGISGTASPGTLSFTGTRGLLNQTLQFSGTCARDPAIDGPCGSNFGGCVVDGGDGDGEGDDEEEIYWGTAEGAFGNELNWDPQRVPGAGETAVFNLDTHSLVTFGQASSERVSVRRGTVTFSQGAYKVESTSLIGANRSLRVGDEAGNIAALRLDDHVLSSEHSAIGRASGANGTVIAGNGTIWQNFGRMSVGLGGIGLLEIVDGAAVSASEARVGDSEESEGSVRVAGSAEKQSGSLWSTGNTAIGLSGSGVLRIEAGGSVVSHDVHLGVNAGSVGNALIGGSFAKGGAVSAWEMGNLVVGGAGEGQITLQSGGELTSGGSTVIGAEAGSEGRFFMFDISALWFPENDVTVGGAGYGVLRVDEATELLVPGTLTLGRDQGSEGIVLITETTTLQSAALTVDGDLLVGVRGEGRISSLGSVLESKGGAFVGADEGGDGHVRLDKAVALWSTPFIELGTTVEDNGTTIVLGTGRLTLNNGAGVLTDSVIVRAGSIIEGSGFILATDAVTVEGTIAPGVAVAEGNGRKQGGLAQRLRGHGTLVIDGDIEMTGSVLDLSIGGTGPNHHDTLVVNGDLNLDGVTIQLHFTGAYGPQAGDLARLVEVSGAFDATDLTLEYAGLEDGFDYAMDEDGGALVFEALTDGIGISPPPTDLNLDGTVNAVDVQLVINGALGLIGVAQSDVDFDGNTNAVDVQLVINAALGL